MTVGKSGEVKMNCGGVSDLTVTAVWEERMDTSAKASAIAVTGLTVTAKETGAYTLNGTVSMGGTVLGRLTDCVGQAEESGVPAAVTGSFPIVSPALFHAEHDTAAVTVQLTGTDPNGQGFYASGRVSTALTVQPPISEVSAGGQFMGKAMSVIIAPVCGGTVHTLRYAFEGESGVIGTGLSGGRHTWTPPMELCASIPHSGSGDCELLCDTYIDGALVGTSACTVTLWVPLEVSLSLDEGWVTLEPANEGTAAEGMDCFVQGISHVRAVFDESKIDGSFAYGGIPDTFAVTVGGVQYGAPYVSEVLPNYGSIPVVCGVTDSRGRRYEQQLQISVLPYTPPVLGDVTAFRCNADGSENERGDSLSLSVGYGFCALGGRNYGAVTAKLRTVGGQWREAVPLPVAAPTVLWSGEISPNDSYEVLAEVTDALGRSASVTVTLPCTNIFFQGRRGGCGAAFGKQAEEDDVLEVAWSLKTKGDLVVEGTVTVGGRQLWEHLYPIGTVCSCEASADPAALFGGTWVQADDTVRRWIRTA